MTTAAFSAMPDNGDAPLDPCARRLYSAGFVRKRNRESAGFSTAPSGTTPWVACRHKAIRSRRAIATTMSLAHPLSRAANAFAGTK